MPFLKILYKILIVEPLILSSKTAIGNNIKRAFVSNFRCYNGTSKKDNRTKSDEHTEVPCS